MRTSALMLPTLAACAFLSACASPPHAASEAVDARAQPASATPAEPADARVERARAVLDAALASRDPEEHGEALAALGASERRDALARLSEALAAEDGAVRFAGARGLAYLRDHRAATAVAAAFRKEKGWAVRKELARAAAACAAKELIPDLRHALKDPHREVAVAAAFSLQDLGDRAGTEALARLGNPERKDVLGDGAQRWSRKVLDGQKDGDRALAARTLARIGTAEDVRLLEPHLTATRSDLRVWAAAAIIRLSPRKLP